MYPGNNNNNSSSGTEDDIMTTITKYVAFCLIQLLIKALTYDL